MKFFTRQLYNSIQPVSGLGEIEDERRSAKADDRWKRICYHYQRHLRSILKSLPKSMQTFSEITLHDGTIQSATRRPDGAVVIQVDATDNPWGPRGLFELVFTGVRSVVGLRKIVGDEWLYEEVHAAPQHSGAQPSGA